MCECFHQEARIHDQVEFIHQAVDGEVAPENAAARITIFLPYRFFSLTEWFSPDISWSHGDLAVVRSSTAAGSLRL